MKKEDSPYFDSAQMARDSVIVARGFWQKVKRTLGQIPFTREAIAAYFCARDKATPVYVKASIFAALAYFIVPLDLIPDVIIGLGYTDDITVFWAAWQAIKGHTTAEHREKAVAALEQLTG